MSHKCQWCPVEVRALYAAAYNAMLASDMAQAGVGDPERARRKMRELRDAVLAIQPGLDAHFDATTGAGAAREHNRNVIRRRMSHRRWR